MACPTCDHTMNRLPAGNAWCPRCGTIADGQDNYVPKLIERVNKFGTNEGGTVKEMMECTLLPHERPWS